MFNVDNKHPSHLCALVASKISISRPFCVVTVLPGCACVVRILVLEAFNAKPTSFKQVTNASTIRAASTEGVANSKMSSANRKSNSGIPPSPKSKPPFCNCSRHFFNAISNTHENSLGLRTQPCRTPALMSNSRLVSCLVMIWPSCSQ